MKHLYETGIKHVQPLMQLLGIFPSVAWCFYLIRYSLFIIRNFEYFPDKCGVLNEIYEPTIFIFKSNTNKISIHIYVEFHNTILILWVVKNTYEISVKFRVMIYLLYALYW